MRVSKFLSLFNRYPTFSDGGKCKRTSKISLFLRADRARTPPMNVSDETAAGPAYSDRKATGRSPAGEVRSDYESSLGSTAINIRFYQTLKRASCLVREKSQDHIPPALLGPPASRKAHWRGSRVRTIVPPCKQKIRCESGAYGPAKKVRPGFGGSLAAREPVWDGEGWGCDRVAGS